MDFRRGLVSDVEFGGEELSEALCWRAARGASSPVGAAGPGEAPAGSGGQDWHWELGWEGQQGHLRAETPLQLLMALEKEGQCRSRRGG